MLGLPVPYVRQYQLFSDLRAKVLVVVVAVVDAAAAADVVVIIVIIIDF